MDWFLFNSLSTTGNRTLKVPRGGKHAWISVQEHRQILLFIRQFEYPGQKLLPSIVKLGQILTPAWTSGWLFSRQFTLDSFLTHFHTSPFKDKLVLVLFNMQYPSQPYGLQPFTQAPARPTCEKLSQEQFESTLQSKTSLAKWHCYVCSQKCSECPSPVSMVLHKSMWRPGGSFSHTKISIEPALQIHAASSSVSFQAQNRLKKIQFPQLSHLPTGNPAALETFSAVHCPKEPVSGHPHLASYFSAGMGLYLAPCCWIFRSHSSALWVVCPVPCCHCCCSFVFPLSVQAPWPRLVNDQNHLLCVCWPGYQAASPQLPPGQLCTFPGKRWGLDRLCLYRFPHTLSSEFSTDLFWKNSFVSEAARWTVNFPAILFEIKLSHDDMNQECVGVKVVACFRVKVEMKALVLGSCSAFLFLQESTVGNCAPISINGSWPVQCLVHQRSSSTQKLFTTCVHAKFKYTLNRYL